MEFKFVFFVYLLSYIVLYVLWTIARSNYISRYKPEIDIKEYITISVGRYYVQRFIINWIILLLSINNLINYSSGYSSLALQFFFFLVCGELFIFFTDPSDENGNVIDSDKAFGADCLIFYCKLKLNNLFTLINEFKINKKDQINE